MTKTTRRIIFFQKFALFTVIAKAYGIDFMVTCFYRSPKEQKARFDEDKSMCDGYKIKSPHQDRLAIDIVVVNKGQLTWDREAYEKLGRIWLDLGGIWDDDEHGKLDDPYHFEYGS